MVRGDTTNGLLVNLGSNNDVTVTGTVDLGTVDNAVLDSIASNTSDCAINTNAIGVDTTSIDTKLTSTNASLVDIETNTDVLTVVGGGTETGCLRVTLASNSSGVLSVDDNGSSLTIDNAELTSIDGKITTCDTSSIAGTVTANLSATDNQVLDDMALSLSNMDTRLVPVYGAGTENLAQRITIATDSTGVLSVDDNGSSLTIDNAELTSLDTKITTCDTSSIAGTVTATQSTHDNFNCNANLQVNDSDLSLGQYVMATSLPVAIASNQSRLNVAQPVSAVYTQANLNDTGVVAYAFACKMNTLYIMNWSASVAFIRIYDLSTAADSSDSPIMKFTLYNYQNASIPFPCPIEFTNGISVRSTTVVGDTDTTSPTTNDVSCVVAYTAT